MAIFVLVLVVVLPTSPRRLKLPTPPGRETPGAMSDGPGGYVGQAVLDSERHDRDRRVYEFGVGNVDTHGTRLLSRRDKMKVARQFTAWNGTQKGTVP